MTLLRVFEEENSACTLFSVLDLNPSVLYIQVYE